MAARETIIRCGDGFPLAATLHGPDGGGNGAAVLIAPATGVPRGYYDKFARHLATRGFAALAIDYRGVGGSRPKDPRRFEARLQHWGERDLAAAIDWLGRELAPRRLLFVGHSVGGQILPLAANAGAIDAALFVASQSGEWRLWGRRERPAFFFFTYVVVPAAVALFGRLPGFLLGGEALPGRIAADWARFCRSRGYIRGLGPHVGEAFGRFRAPLCFYSFADDRRYGPRRAVEALMDWYGSADKEHRHVAPADVGAAAIGHFGFFRERFAGSLWRDAIAWLERQAAASGASAIASD
jgi:predicted alpha/beta hydrolase